MVQIFVKTLAKTYTIEIDKNDNIRKIKNILAMKISGDFGFEILPEDFRLIAAGKEYKLTDKINILEDEPRLVMRLRGGRPTRSQKNQLFLIIHPGRRNLILDNIESNDNVDDIYNKVASKLSKDTGENIEINDFHILGTENQDLTELNIDFFKETGEGHILFLKKSFSKKKKRRLKLTTEQFELSFKDSDITREDIELFLEGEKDLMLKEDDNKIILSLDNDFINFEIKLKTLNLIFSVEKEDIENQLLDHLEKYDL